MAQRPLLTDAQYERTQSIVRAFCDTDGKDLNEQLIVKDKKNKHTSYITDYWFDMYLKDRRPVVLNHNPFIAFNDDKRPEYMSPLVRACNMLRSATRFMLTLRAELLTPEVYHLDPNKSDTPLFTKVVRWLPATLSWYGAYMFNAYPLDMTQFPNLMCSTRVPKPGKDILVRDDKASHVCVMRNGRFYTMPMLDDDGNVLSSEDVLAHLQHIMSDPGGDVPPTHCPGYLTSEDRDTWAQARQHLHDIGNSDVLDAIDKSMFMLCFDDVAYGDDGVAIARNFLHGDGANRWFDKSFSVLLQGDGRAAVNFEHSWGDGVAVLRFFNEVYNESIGSPRCSADTRPTPGLKADTAVKKLEFTLDDAARASITAAKDKFHATVDSMAMHAFKSDSFGKRLVKRENVSPDAIMQLGFQLAYYYYAESTVSTYESCSTAAFRRGRTETVRPATTLTQQCVSAIHGKQTSVEEIKELMRSCSITHGKLIKQAAMGQGFDRHLFALRHLAEEQGVKCDMFEDPAYASICRIIISTSTLSTDSVMIGGFGPVSPECLGIGYNITDDGLGCVLSTYRSHQNGAEFIRCLEQSFRDIHNVLSHTTEKGS